MADELTERIIGAAIEVHRILGPGWLESIYEEALHHELSLRGLPVRRQVDIVVRYKEKNIGGQRLDLIVADEVVVELKSQRSLPEVAAAQVLSYLKASGMKRGLLINFGEQKLTDGVKRFSL